MVRIRSPAPTSSARVSAVCTIVTPRRSRRSPRPALLFGPALLSTSIGSSREARSAGNSPARTAASIADAKPAGQHRPARGHSIQPRDGVPADQLEQLDDAKRQAHAERPAQQAPAAGSPWTPGGTAPPGPCPGRCARRIPAAVAVRAPAAAPRHSRTRSAAPARPRPTAAAGCAGRRDSIRRPGRCTCGVMPSKVALGLRLPRGDQTVSSPCACWGVAPSRSRPTTSQSGRFRPRRVGSHRNPEIHQRVHVVVRLLRARRRRQKADARRHHADHRGRRVPAADAQRLADDVRIAVELPLPELVAEDDHRHRAGPGFGLHETCGPARAASPVTRK